MKETTVTEAVQILRAQGERISVRAVHALTGGSFRDITKLLRDAREFLAHDEVAALDAEAPEPASPLLPGRLVEAQQVAVAADQAVSAAQSSLDEAVTRLRALRARRPPDATTPEAVTSAVAAHMAHDARAAEVVREVEQLQRIVEARRAEAREAKDEWRGVQLRVRQLRDEVSPPLRQRLQDARQELEMLERDTAHRLRLGRTRVEGLARAPEANEAELRTLTGEHGPDAAA
jgi:hypothetical protein